MSIQCPITNLPLRNSAKYPEIYISRCGRIYHNPQQHKFVILARTDKYRYLTVPYDKPGHFEYTHIVVGHAWVFNPCPGVFNVIDHVDRDCQNNDAASNLRWITQQLNSLNREIPKGWEKVVKKNGAVFYRSVISINKKRHVTYCRNKEEAIDCSKRRQKEFFASIYQRHVDDFKKLGVVHERLAHHVCWTDRPVETPEGFTPGGPSVRRSTEGRRPQFVC